MLKPTKMTRVVIAGTKDLMGPAVSSLHRLNVLHITDYLEDTESFKIGRPLKAASKLSEYLLSLRVISNQLGIGEKETISKQTESVGPRMFSGMSPAPAGHLVSTGADRSLLQSCDIRSR